ncbi:MAG: hypothetical protein KAI79_04335, partial [Bacteroidales bacterium]|nr:hypothetical protein [Bacteroidales bacterium]
MQSEQINISPFKEPEFYDGQEEDLPFYSCCFSGYKDFALEITRYWENGFKNKFIVAIFDWEDKYDKKKKINKLLEIKDLKGKFEEATDKFYWKGYKRY